MNVALIDVDLPRNGKVKFPTLTLMKISAYCKARGDSVHLLTVNEYLSGDLFNRYDKAYASCIFSKNAQKAKLLEGMGVIVGGSGYDINKRLPDEIEHIMPDYSLYGITDTAYGFLTRGCPRGCPFCIVAGKEGQQSRKVADLSEWWSGQKNIKLLDPNLLACSSHMELMHQLIESGANIDITQGLDIRLLNDDNLQLINNMKIKMLHFAWDNPNDKSTQQALQKFREKSIIDARKVGVYVLTNYWSTLADDLKRIYWLRDNGYSPYVMIYDKDHAPVEIRLLQRWVNNKIIFKSVDKFEDYDRRIG